MARCEPAQRGGRPAADEEPAGEQRETEHRGCDETDFAGFLPGRVALIQQGTCALRLKVRNAIDAGAAAVVLFSEGQPSRLGLFPLGSGPLFDRPVVTTTFALGRQLYEATLAGSVVVRVAARGAMLEVASENVIADSPDGRLDRTVMVGAHLDSAETGPRMNDNASGSATILEIARQLTVQGMPDEPPPLCLVGRRGVQPGRLQPLPERADRDRARRDRALPQRRHGRLVELHPRRLRR